MLNPVGSRSAQSPKGLQLREKPEASCASQNWVRLSTPQNRVPVSNQGWNTYTPKGLDQDLKGQNLIPGACP